MKLRQHLEPSLAELLPGQNKAAGDFKDLLAEEGTLDRLLVSISLESPSEDPTEELDLLIEGAEFISGRLMNLGLAVEARSLCGR